ncbi:MAG: GGDEF domain-containing protein, partial [Chloroflexi bacterium]|nr:GGDEF domain-containing protein [Chloroflexota bacterium]
MAHDRAELRNRLLERHEQIAAAWRAALVPTAYVPLSADEQRQALIGLTDRLIDALLAEPYAPIESSSVGADLVDLGFARASALGRSVDVLGRELLADAPPEELPDLQGRLATLL